MISETEGIVLRQTKISGGRRIISLFTKRYGKISAGTSLNERTRGRQVPALRPFTYGRYELYVKGQYYNINRAETIRSHYGFGEDIDKYMNASYALEFADKVTEEGQPAPGLFVLTADLLDELERRKERCGTLTAAFEVRAVSELGIFPRIDACAVCGKKKEPAFFSVADGGTVCADCPKSGPSALIYDAGFDIVNIIGYFKNNPLRSLRNLALGEDKADLIRSMMLEYTRYHLDFGELKSESFIGSVKGR